MPEARHRNTLFMFASVMIVLVIVVPVFFKVLQRVKNYTLPDYGNVGSFDPHREGGHLFPNLDMSLRGERLNVPIRFITNSKGFRNDREFDYTHDEKTFRILFLGDSFVDGLRTDQKGTIGYVLEEFLNKVAQGDGFEDYEVMISGHNNPANALYYYQEHGWKYSPDLVILGITLGNDITWHNYKTGMLPGRNDEGELHLTPTDDPPQAGTVQMDLLLPADAYSTKENFWEAFKNLELYIRNHLSRIYAFGYDIPPALGPGSSSRRHVYAAGFFISLGLFYRPVMPEIEEMYRDFEEVLRGMHDRITNDGIEFLAVLFPVRMQVSEKEWRLLIKYYSVDEGKFDLTYPDRRISLFCEQNSIDCIGMIREFKQDLEKHDLPLYRSRGDMHFNERGQELAGKVIGKKVVARISHLTRAGKIE